MTEEELGKLSWDQVIAMIHAVELARDSWMQKHDNLCHELGECREKLEQARAMLNTCHEQHEGQINRAAQAEKDRDLLGDRAKFLTHLLMNKFGHNPLWTQDQLDALSRCKPVEPDVARKDAGHGQ